MMLFRLAALVALVLSAPVAAQTAEADSLLNRFIETVGYDRFLNRTFSPGLPDAPDGVPHLERIRSVWDSFFSPTWYRARVRREFLAGSSADELRSMLAWAEDPVVRRAIAHDYASAAALAPRVGEPDPRRKEAARRVSRAAGDGLFWVQAEADRALAFVLFARGNALTPAERAEYQAQTSRMVRAYRAEGVEFAVQMIADRFADFPAADLEHYAEALEAPAGRAYLRLVVEGPPRAYQSALEIALRKATK